MMVILYQTCCGGSFQDDDEVVIVQVVKSVYIYLKFYLRFMEPWSLVKLILDVYINYTFVITKSIARIEEFNVLITLKCIYISITLAFQEYFQG